MKSPSLPISAVIIAQDEAEKITACIHSLSFAAEVLVIDGGSRDGTVEAARAAGARVLINPWPGYVEQRRFALENASHEWILSVDADERISTELAENIRKILTAPDRNGYLVNRLNHFLGHPVRSCGWYPDKILRLFRRDAVSLPSVRIHEGFDLEGEAGELEGFLLHYSYASIEEYLAKMNRYTSLEVQDKLARIAGKKTHWYDPVLHSLSRFYRMYIIKNGFRDGFIGFLVSWFSSLYLFVLYAKMRETQSGESERLSK